jgi:signal transduction histidine kinase
MADIMRNALANRHYVGEAFRDNVVLDYAGLTGHDRLRLSSDADLAALVTDVASTADARARAEGITMSVNVVENLPRIALDERSIRRALENLVGNAIKYAADGRWIGLTVSRSRSRGVDEVQVTVSTAP